MDAANQQPGEAPLGDDPASTRHPFRDVILNAWGDLFRSREGLLLRIYGRTPEITPRGTAAPSTLAEVHARIDAQWPDAGISAIDRDLSETRMVRSHRILSAWLVFWSTLVPIAGIAAFIVWRLSRIQGPNGTDIAVVIVTSLILFPLLAILCLLLQAPLMVTLVRLLIHQSTTKQVLDSGNADDDPQA